MENQLNEKQQFWLDHIKTALSSGISMNAYAKQHDLDIKSLYSWKSQFVKKGIISAPKQSAFTKVKNVQLPKQAPTNQYPYSAKLPNGIELRLEALTTSTLQLLSSL